MLIVLRLFLVAVSFSGLCAFVRSRFDIDCFVAPMIAASSIIVVLMIAGMLGFLEFACCALYAGGIVGGGYGCFLRKHRPKWPLLLISLGFLGFLCWRLLPVHLQHFDTFSHWGVAARHLVRHNRFPGNGDLVEFQGYPLGSACFIYYFSAMIDHEGVFLVAQNFLHAAIFLPMFSLVQHRRKALYPFIAAMFLIYFSYSCAEQNLLVDLLQTFYGLGMAAAVLRYRNDLKRALLSTLPAMIAVTYVKNSGMFFALCSAAMLFIVMKRVKKFNKRRAIGLVIIPILAYCIWMIYIRLHYTDAISAYHTVSLTMYIRHIRIKSKWVMLRIALEMLLHFFSIRREQCAILVLFLCCLPVLFYVLRSFPPELRRRYFRACKGAVAIFIVWYFMIFCMFIVSMYADEAVRLQGIERYEPTGYSYSAGIIIALLFCALDNKYGQIRLPDRVAAKLSAIAVGVVLIASLFQGHTELSGLYLRNRTLDWPRGQLITMRDTYHLADNDCYLIFYTSKPRGKSYMYMATKYDLQTSKLFFLTFTDETHREYSDNQAPIADIDAHLDDVLGQIDAVLLLDDDPNFDALLSKHLQALDLNVPIFRTPDFAG